MTPSVALAIALSTQVAGSADATIVLPPETPAIMLVVPPKGTTPPLPAAACLRAASATFADLSGLRILSAEQAGLDRAHLDSCDAGRRFTCWTQVVRKVDNAARYLFVLIVRQSGSGVQLNLLLLDTERAYDTFATHPRGSDWEEKVESSIFESTRRTPPAVVAADEASLAGYFRATATEHLQGTLAKEGHWKPHGRIAIQSNAAGRAIEIDKRIAGVTAKGQTLVERVPIGPRDVVISEAQLELTRVTVDVDRGKTTEITIIDAPAAPNPIRTASLWIGGAAVAGGASLIAYSFVQAGDVRAGCLLRPGSVAEDCPNVSAPAFGESTSTPSTDPDTGGTLPIAPLGAALVAAGASWAAGAWLADAGDAPWWALGIGVLAGGIVLATGAAVSP